MTAAGGRVDPSTPAVARTSVVGVTAFLAGLGLGLLVAAQVGLETAGEVASVAALRTSLLATASNPLTIVSWATPFPAASTARVVTGGPGAVALLVVIGLGSVGWFTALAGTAAVLRRGLGPRTVR